VANLNPCYRPIDGDLILPILRDIAQGMRFLHVNNPPIIHGDLKSANCLVDSHFRAKVSDFGLTAKQTLGVTGTPYWMDPVLLRGEARNSRETDVYSFGIMLFELYARAEPYDGEQLESVLREVCDPTINKRPPVPVDTPAAIASLMQECHSSTHDGRPSFEEIDKRLRRIDAEQVEPGESRFSSQRKKSARNEDLLNKVFPKHVADALRAGRSVEPDRKDLVTIFFSGS
jgi:guanylate cyclase, other